MIEISHLTKRYGDRTAVDDLSLQIGSGKIYGFLGPNGAGKSTTMNMITGYIAATRGTVKINGFDIFRQPEQARMCVGYLPEQPPLYMDMTTVEYLRFAADLKKIPKKKKRQYIDEAMELTKITDTKNRLIRNLSKGYRQRVGFAQAVLGYPQVIILDEPTVGLDPQQMMEIRSLIRNLGKRHTVILSSHILSEVKEICEHIFIISNGRLAASDTTQNLIAKMSKEQELRLLVKGEKDAVMQILPKINGIASVSVTKDGEKGCMRIALQAEQGKDIREQLFFAFAQTGIPILEMTAAGKSLEQVFLELTEQGRSPVKDIQTGQEESGISDENQKDLSMAEESGQTGQKADATETGAEQTKTGQIKSDQIKAGQTGAEQTETEETERKQTEAGQTETGRKQMKQNKRAGNTESGRQAK